MPTEIPVQGVGVRVTLRNSSAKMPFGKEYTAKGFYYQGKYIITVGAIAAGGSNTIRLKFLRAEIESLVAL